MNYYKVAVDAPLFGPLTYSSPESLVPGQTVSVSLGKRVTRGVIIASDEAPSSDYKIKEIVSIDTKYPPFKAEYLSWLEWLSDYYVYPIGSVAALAYPPLEPSQKKRKSKKGPVIKEVTSDQPKQLTKEQGDAFEKISSQGGFSVHLLHGVTGSGKTEVYLQLLDLCLKKNKSGLVLVPEISLTPQLIDRFSSRFGGDKIAVIHSHLTEREKTEQWWSVVNSEKKILIGARSALFCPAPDLGLIVVDEEHEGSYKQDEKLKYSARDAAIVLAKNYNVPIVLGSATPSLETWNHAITKKYQLHEMKSRVSNRALPQVEIIDMRDKTQFGEGLPFWMSTPLYNAISETLEKKQQVALFLNRRGVAQTVMCRSCGFSHRCPNCEIALTLHGERHLVCHYCDYSERKNDACPQCKDGELAQLGVGTEQIEKDIIKLFPTAEVARADRDEIQSRESLEDLISRMENNQIQVLIGTQMIAKGLDFKNLTLVGLVLADVGFNLPDFRSTERSFQLLTQVSGRSGRHFDDGGRVLIQTYNSEYQALSFSINADYSGFAAEELQLRKELRYPPFGRLASVRLSSSDQRRAESIARTCAERASQLLKKFTQYNDIQVLGPAPAPLFKIRNQYRYHLLLKASPGAKLSSFCRQLLGDLKWAESGTKVQVDIDPLHLL